MEKLTAKDKILDVLREVYPKGLGYNGLRLKGVHDKFLRKYVPEHVKAGFIEVKKETCRGGIRNVHFLTKEGKEYLDMSKELRKIEKEFLEKFGIGLDAENKIRNYAFEKKLRLYENIVSSIVDDLLRMDNKSAVQFLKTTLAVAQRINKKVLSNLEIEREIYETEKRALQKMTSG